MIGEKGIVVECLKKDVAGDALLWACDAGDGLPNDSEKDGTVWESIIDFLFSSL